MPISIRIAGNTERPTLLAIKAKGYTITNYYYKDSKRELEARYDAEKGNNKFSANSPEELLGLIAMWEVRGDDWKYDCRSEPDLLDELMESSVTYDAEGNVIIE